ncbi:MAG: DUF6037 family protein [Pseudomonadota bacterium]|nr:DUF6037 family protein [Pseudomonadota bacterium]
MVQMHGLRRLHQAMRTNGDQRAHFRITHNGIDFDCLFLVDIVPFEFVLAAIGHPDVAIVLPVLKGYYVMPDFGEDYKPIAQLFNNAAGSFTPFRPSGFLQEIDAAIPTGYRQPTLGDITRAYRHHLDEADKPHFLGWLDNNLTPPNRVSVANLDKTKRCFGQRIRDICERTNQSSRWTADASKAKAFVAPGP